MKKMHIALICVVMLGLCACGGGDVANSPSAPQPSQEESQPTQASGQGYSQWFQAGETNSGDNPLFGELTLDKLEGWWQRPDGYASEGISMVDVFYIDAAAGTWTVYSKLGEAGDTLAASIEDGQLCLEFFLDDVYYEVRNGELINEDGSVDFVRGEPVDAPDYSAYKGRWYKDGDMSSSYFEIIDNNFQEYMVAYDGGEDILLDEGSFQLGYITLYVGDEVREDVLHLNLEGHSFMTDDLYPMDNGVALLEDSFSDDCYIREDAIGTSAGDDALLTHRLLSNSWRMDTDEGSKNISFSYPDIFYKYEYPPGGGEATETGRGSWSKDGINITLYYNDGREEDLLLLEDEDQLIGNDGEIYDEGW